MTQETVTLESGTLWTNTVRRTKTALECGSLQPIPTKYEWLEQAGIRFLVRIVNNLVHKDKASHKQANKTEFNPFLPYEEDLFVSDISPTHLCLLNKYNVVDYHLLIITRLFEDQENWLTWHDFEAMWLSLAEIDGLAFYNAGQEAGASQRHKHLQLVPLPVVEGVSPLDAIVAAITWDSPSIGTSALFPFNHAIANFNFTELPPPSEAAEITLKLYHQLLARTGLSVTGTRQTGAYNLLATRQWMMVVPRSQESFESIAVNSLGFAGALLVRNHRQLQRLKDIGPLTILKNVTTNH
jgi:ATP adenylyltransferase